MSPIVGIRRPRVVGLEAILFVHLPADTTPRVHLEMYAEESL
jgi:hypothetical protein